MTHLHETPPHTSPVPVDVLEMQIQLRVRSFAHALVPTNEEETALYAKSLKENVIAFVSDEFNKSDAIECAILAAANCDVVATDGKISGAAYVAQVLERIKVDSTQ